MEIYNKRFIINSNVSLGIITYEKENPICFVVEDGKRGVKIKGETRIPAGRYKLGIRKEDTPLTVNSRNRPNYKGWFKYFIEVLDVPNFSNIYFHIGNSEKDTEGCQLLNYNARLSNGMIVCSESQPAVKYFYERFYNRILAGEEFYYNVIDL